MPLLVCDHAERLPRQIAPAVGTRHQLVEDGREIVQSLEVRQRQLVQYLVAPLGEPHPDEPSVVRIGRPDHQAAGFGAVDELDGAVRLEQQVAGDVTDRRRYPSAVALNGDEQLVLDVRETGGLRLVFAPALETPQRDAERQQLLEIVLAWQGRATFLASGW